MRLMPALSRPQKITFDEMLFRPHPNPKSMLCSAESMKEPTWI